MTVAHEHELFEVALDSANEYSRSMNIDEFSKLATGIVAIVGSIAGPVIAWSIMTRQTRLQAQIAARAAIDNVSAKRQVWIDELRSDTAELISVMELEQRYVERIRGADAPERWQQAVDDSYQAESKANMLLYRIRLRANPLEERHVSFIRRLDELVAINKKLSVIRPTEPEALKRDFVRVRDAAISELQVVLKEEWNRVRNGVGG